MADRCPICGGFRPSLEPSWLHEELGGARPPFIAGLCTLCIMRSMNETPSLPDYSAPARQMNESDVITFTIKYLGEAARRVAAGKPAYRCEVAVDDGWSGGQCGRFANELMLGRWICHVCRRAMERGRELSFVGTGDVAPRLIAVWARNEQEAVDRARAMWLKRDKLP